MCIYKKLRYSIFLDPAKITIYNIRVDYGNAWFNHAILLFIGDYAYFTYLWSVDYIRDALTDILSEEHDFVQFSRRQSIKNIIRANGMVGHHIKREHMRRMILASLRPECERFGHARTKCVRVRIPSVHEIPFYYVIRFKSEYATIQWGRYTFDINRPDFKFRTRADPMKYIKDYARFIATDFKYINSIAWYDNTPELHTMGLSMRDLNECRRAINNKALDNLITFTPKNFRTRLRTIFAHRDFDDEHTKTIHALYEIFDRYLILDVIHIILEYAGIC